LKREREEEEKFLKEEEQKRTGLSPYFRVAELFVRVLQLPIDNLEEYVFFFFSFVLHFCFECRVNVCASLLAA
jgi:hypothetical protein